MNGIKVLAEKLDNVSAEGMKKIVFDLRHEWKGSFLVVLGAEADDKALLNVALSDDLVKDKGMDAGKIVRELATLIRGGEVDSLSLLLPEVATPGAKGSSGGGRKMVRIVNGCL